MSDLTSNQDFVPMTADRFVDELCTIQYISPQLREVIKARIETLELRLAGSDALLEGALQRLAEPPTECQRCHCQERAQKFIGDPRLGVFGGPQKCSVCDKLWGPFPCMRADCAFHPRASLTKSATLDSSRCCPANTEEATRKCKDQNGATCSAHETSERLSHHIYCASVYSDPITGVQHQCTCKPESEEGSL